MSLKSTLSATRSASKGCTYTDKHDSADYEMHSPQSRSWAHQQCSLISVTSRVTMETLMWAQQPTQVNFSTSAGFSALIRYQQTPKSPLPTSLTTCLAVRQPAQVCCSTLAYQSSTMLWACICEHRGVTKDALVGLNRCSSQYRSAAALQHVQGAGRGCAQYVPQASHLPGICTPPRRGTAAD